MTYDLSKHPFFEPWEDPETGVLSYILTERVAPIQQTFYFTNPGISRDGKWMWLYVAFPPGDGHTLAVVSLDPDNPMIRHFPQALYTGASPMVDPEGDAVYFCARARVWHMPIESGEATEVCRLSDDFIANRRCDYIATHLSRSCDGKYFILDGGVGNTYFIGIGDIKTGEVKILHEFSRCVNHAQFSLTDPSLFSFAEECGNDPISGRPFTFDHRVWLMNIDCTRYEPATPNRWDCRTAGACHEWWAANGTICWPDWMLGLQECNVDTMETSVAWPRGLCHAHCDRTCNYFCADDSPYSWTSRPCKVWFYDRRAKKEILIASGLPQPEIHRTWYHPDPHPHFSPDGANVVYTTTARGHVDAAIAPLDGILDRLATQGCRPPAFGDWDPDC